MSRKTKPNGSNSNATQQQPKRERLEWCNISLNEEDGAILSEEERTVDDLAAQLVGMALVGWDINIKRSTSDNSCMVSAIADNPNTSDSRVGISAFSDNFPDAILALLYKYHVKCESQVPSPTTTSTRRFR